MGRMVREDVPGRPRGSSAPVWRSPEPDAGKRCRLRQPGSVAHQGRQRAEGRAHVALVPAPWSWPLMLTGAFVVVRRRMMVMRRPMRAGVVIVLADRQLAFACQSRPPRKAWTPPPHPGSGAGWPSAAGSRFGTVFTVRAKVAVGA